MVNSVPDAWCLERERRWPSPIESRLSRVSQQHSPGLEPLHLSRVSSIAKRWNLLRSQLVLAVQVALVDLQETILISNGTITILFLKKNSTYQF